MIMKLSDYLTVRRTHTIHATRKTPAININESASSSDVGTTVRTNTCMCITVSEIKYRKSTREITLKQKKENHILEQIKY